jgi:soluble lytic murein transglycosylase-like protein
MNDKETADTYFKIAASFPFTFYGLLAETRLGVTPAVALAKKGLPPTFQGGDRDGLTASLNDDFSWAKSNAQARRMGALVQIGRTVDAKEEVQAAMQHASDSTERDHWLALAAYNNVTVSQLRATDRLFDETLYPIPNYQLSGASGVDRALVFAFARKESKFNANARSYSGAYGLLQLMPSTAALVENDSSYTSKPSKLLKPATNLRVGQKYIARLMDSKIIEGDLLRTIAAYNAGPRPVKDAMDNLGNDYDSLLVMESIPVAQTRQYVEEVAANYWIYRQIMGKDSPSLTQAAADARIIDASADAEPSKVALNDDDN